MFEHLKTPAAQYRPAVFWVWSEIPDISEIARQLEEMRDKGIGGFFIDGKLAARDAESETELVDCIQETCRIAKEIGLQVYEYDQPRTGMINEPILRDKLSSSAAHLDGQQRILARLPINRADWTLSLADLKKSIDLQACLGANFFCPDAFYYSFAGQLRPHLPPSQFYQATYWRHYKRLTDYAARLSYVLSQGRHKAQIALLRPGRRSEPLEMETVKWLAAYCDALIAEQADFDIIDEDSLSQAMCADERLQIADEAYELLILPPLDAISCKTAEKISAFTDEGGRALGTMRLPSRDSSGQHDTYVREIIDSVFDPEANAATVHFLDIERTDDLPDTLAQALNVSIKRNVSIRSGSGQNRDIVFTHRSTGEIDVFFFSNQSPQPREVKISVRCDRAPHLLDLETGASIALPNCTQQGSRTVLLHRFEGYGSLMMAFGKYPALAVSPPVVEEGQEITIDDDWEFSLEQPNSISLDDWAFNTLIQDDREIFEYVTSFEADYIPPSLQLVLERTSGFGTESGLEVYVNDEPAPVWDGWVTDVNFKTIEISALTHKGANRIGMLVRRAGWTGDPVPTPARARLMGDFSLTENLRLAPPVTGIRSGSWTEQGYPYYSGTATYKQTVQIPTFAQGQRVIICAHCAGGIVEFVVNGAVACLRPWASYEADITALVKPGANRIELRVTNSLANMLLNRPVISGLIDGASAFLA